MLTHAPGRSYRRSQSVRRILKRYRPGCAPPQGQFFAHLIRPTTRYRPDIEALRAAPARVVVAGGATSKGQLANRTAVAFARQLGTTVVDFPGDHGGFVALPEQCGRVLDRVLTETT